MVTEEEIIYFRLNTTFLESCIDAAATTECYGIILQKCRILSKLKL
jgi:hypothetical protein